MAGSDPTRDKFETLIAAAAPVLDTILAVGERISRIAEPVDYEYYPVRDESTGDESGTEDSAARHPGSSRTDGTGQRNGSAR